MLSINESPDVVLLQQHGGRPLMDGQHQASPPFYTVSEICWYREKNATILSTLIFEDLII